VFNLRRRFGLPPRDVEPADHFIIARTSARVAALHVDRVVELIHIDDAAVADPTKQVAESPLVAGVALMDDGLALIYNVDTFLSRAEAESLDSALASADSAELARQPSQAR
jgi:purine-binding chemotaxis protein CheW